MSTHDHTANRAAGTAAKPEAAPEPEIPTATGGANGDARETGDATVPRFASACARGASDPAAEPHVAPARIWLARAAVGAVFFLNVMCAVQFIVWPAIFAPAYGLPPTPESHAMVAGLGVAFLMWNATYPPVLANPVRFRAIYLVVLAQQAIGLVGESLIWTSLAQQGLAASQMAHGILRFIAFDGVGLILMFAAFILLMTSINARR